MNLALGSVWGRTRFPLLLLVSSGTRTFVVRGMAATTSKVIDSHLHVWANTAEAAIAFPYVQEPPDHLKNCASTDELLKQMKEHGVDGALIVQPINHKFDHSYVLSSIKSHPDKFKGMLLHDPSMETEEAVARAEELALAGFVGVRFNPYLWPSSSAGEKKWEPMSKGAGLAVYKRCGELNIPVGIMCFQGLSLHYDDILALLKQSPDTIMILDHFGFTSVDDPSAFDQLLQLAQCPNVFVKVSALFRLGDENGESYRRVRKERFLPLLEAFGADRLMYGSDFPFVLDQPQAYEMHKLVASWIDDSDKRAAVMGGTAERVFGPWGNVPKQSSS